MQAKYRESLKRLDDALELLELAGDSADLPVLRPEFESEQDEGSKQSKPEADRRGIKSGPAETARTLAGKRNRSQPAKKGHKAEMLVMLFLVLALGGAAGWWFGYEQPRRQAVAIAEAEEAGEAALEEFATALAALEDIPDKLALVRFEEQAKVLGEAHGPAFGERATRAFRDKEVEVQRRRESVSSEMLRQLAELDGAARREANQLRDLDGRKRDLARLVDEARREDDASLADWASRRANFFDKAATRSDKKERLQAIVSDVLLRIRRH